MAKHGRRLVGKAIVTEIEKRNILVVCNNQSHWLVPQEIKGGSGGVDVDDAGNLFYVSTPSSGSFYFVPDKKT